MGSKRDFGCAAWQSDMARFECWPGDVETAKMRSNYSKNKRRLISLN